MFALAACNAPDLAAPASPACTAIFSDSEDDLTFDSAAAARDCVDELAALDESQQRDVLEGLFVARNISIPPGELLQVGDRLGEPAARLARAIGLSGIPRGEEDAHTAIVDAELERARAANDRLSEAVNLATLGMLAYRRSDFEIMAAQFERAAKIASDLEAYGLEARYLVAHGLARRRDGDVDGALLLYRDALRLADHVEGSEIIRVCRNLTGLAADEDAMSQESLLDRISSSAEDDPEFSRCLEWGRIRRLTLMNRFDDVEAALAAMEDRGSLERLEVVQPDFQVLVAEFEYARGQSVSAIAAFTSALELLSENDDPNLEVHIRNNVGSILYDMGEYDQASSEFAKAIEALERIGVNAQTVRATIEANIGQARAANGDHLGAIEYFERSKEGLASDPGHRSHGFVDYNLAKSLAATGREEEAILAAERAIPITLEKRNPLEAAAIYGWLGSRYLEADQIGKAQYALARTEEIVAREDVDRRSLDSDPIYNEWDVAYHGNMAELLTRMGQSSEAITHSQRALELSNVRFARERMRAVANLDMQMRLFAQDQELADSLRDTRLRELERDQATAQRSFLAVLAVLAILAAGFAAIAYRYQRRLAAAKDTYLAETWHRADNNLQLITSLLRAGARRSRRGEDPNGFAEAAAERAHTMALIQTHLYSAQYADHVDIPAFLNDLLELLRGSLGRSGIELVGHFEDIKMPVSALTPVGLIVAELVTNSYKHAFGEDANGTISVELSEQDGKCLLVVEDNGCGMIGDGENILSNGMGLELLEDLVAQIGGKVSRPQSTIGTRWDIRF